jgi:hypothetical protein
MKKFMKSFVIVAVVVIALGSTTAVFAQSGTAQGSATVLANGRGGWGGRGSRSGVMQQDQLQLEDELLHDEIISAFEVALGIPADELNARLDAGETLMQIVISTGLDFEAAQALIDEVHAQVLAQAVLDGIITQEQADWLITRLGGQAYMGGANGAGNDFGMRNSGMRGSGQSFYGTGECPYTTTD